MSATKHFAVEQAEGVLIISPQGSIGALDAESIRTEWAGVLDRLATSGTLHVVIDLQGLEYFGSIVLELIVVLWKRLSVNNGKLAICNVSSVGLEILHAAKFDTIWPIVSSLDEAKRAVLD